MAQKNIYFDESGFTGYNLLDPDQPFFVIASADIAPELSEKILKESFPNYQGAEFKFSNIWRSSNATGLITFARKLGPLSEQTFVWITDKKYSVLTKIVDFLIEPHVTDGGYDFYSDGFCWKYVNYIYFALVHIAPPEILVRLLDTYQAFSRSPTQDSLDIFTKQLADLTVQAQEPAKMFLEQMMQGAILFNHYHELDDFKKTNELHVTTMLALVSHWREKHSEDFAIVHDASANFFRHREIWNKITNSDVPGYMHTTGSGSEVKFPLRVIETTATDSKSNFSVQLCDVLAGVVARHFDERIEGIDRELLDKIIEAGLGAITFDGILPSTIFPNFPPKRLIGPDAVDKFMMNIFYPPKE